MSRTVPLILYGIGCFTLGVALFSFAITYTDFFNKPQLGNQENTAYESCDIQFSNGQILKSVPVAFSEAQQVRGLSKTNDVGNGMLFTWTATTPRTFWMRDTWIPLDIGFFDAEGTLFSVKHMPPNSDTIHSSGQPVRYALELAEGGFKRHKIDVNTRIIQFLCTQYLDVRSFP